MVDREEKEGGAQLADIREWISKSSPCFQITSCLVNSLICKNIFLLCLRKSLRISMGIRQVVWPSFGQCRHARFVRSLFSLEIYLSSPERSSCVSFVCPTQNRPVSLNRSIRKWSRRGSIHRIKSRLTSTVENSSLIHAGISAYKNVSKMLVKLGIWNEVNTGWQLDATFRNNLTGAIFGGYDLASLIDDERRHASFRNTNWFDESDSTSAPSDRSLKKIDDLNTYSSTRWDVGHPFFSTLVFEHLFPLVLVYLTISCESRQDQSDV